MAHLRAGVRVRGLDPIPAYPVPAFLGTVVGRGDLHRRGSRDLDLEINGSQRKYIPVLAASERIIDVAAETLRCGHPSHTRWRGFSGPPLAHNARWYPETRAGRGFRDAGGGMRWTPG